MFEVKSSMLEEYAAAAPGGEADLRAFGRQAGTAARRPAGAADDRTIGDVIRTGKRGTR